ncbi:helix-turn-helix transcriptional regulator (plasmid) [Klebsiella oxytoca]|uniref:helix-turn-helix transcriptional regulator n=1 Tax=Klebsiella oxytoca TaxID=571 RepID=UPI003981A771
MLPDEVMFPPQNIMGLRSKKYSSALMSETIKDMLNWIEINLSESLTTRTLSDRAGYSTWHFQRCFKKIVGMSPINYIRGRKMAVAAQLILDGGHTLTDIAHYLGYNQQSTFCRIFKQYYSMTPNKYRHNCECNATAL